MESVYQRAIGALQRSNRVVALGYRFNENDKDSYDRLLKKTAAHSILVVSPDADECSRRLATEYRGIKWAPLNLTFAEWAALGFPLTD